ncbi:DMT family transporter [Anaerosalibacter massiliensis]|uniref:DMT family transporter n=1 Tax=Anaerosalibacter massiliensis TaxID=1347392 RepID=A0A9X2MLA5_9FIRM|nr:DMT family transporter [Anaerosalibacter massiliensis]MCR2043296.1 DMT family transporter [Anaerosalibacter massiliensis]
MERFFTKKINILIISLIAMTLWGSAFPVLKVSYEKLAIEGPDIYSKIYFAGLRFFIASILVFLAAKLIFRMDINIEKGYIKPFIILGVLQTTLQYFFFYIGVANTTGIKSAIIQASSTFFTVIFAHFIYSDDKLNMQKILSLILGFGGILIVNIGKDFDLSFKLIGEGFLLFSALVSTIATIYVKDISQGIEPTFLTGGQMFFGSLPLLIVGKLGMKGAKLTFDRISFSLLLYSAFLSATAFFLWYMILKYNKPGEVSIYRLFIPIFGASFSAIFIESEHFTVNLIIGLILVVLGIAVLNLEKKKRYE